MYRAFYLALCLFPWSVYAQETLPRCKVGVVPQFEQRRIFETWKPLLKALEKQGVSCQFKLIGSKNIPEFEKAFQKGEYDFAYMNPYHAVMANSAAGYTPLVRSGAKMLKGILVAKKTMPPISLEDLQEQTLAFPAPNALGASLLMRTELSTKKDISFTPKYVKTHGSVYLSVAKGLFPAGGGVMRTFNAQPKELKDMLEVIYTTTAVPAHPIVAHPRVPLDVQKQLQQAFLDIEKNAPHLLKGLPMKKPILTSMSDYEGLASMGLEKFAE